MQRRAPCAKSRAVINMGAAPRPCRHALAGVLTLPGPLAVEGAVAPQKQVPDSSGRHRASTVYRTHRRCSAPAATVTAASAAFALSTQTMRR